MSARGFGSNNAAALVTGALSSYSTPPTVKDDINRGYVAGQYWITPEKYVFKLYRNDAGAAAWQRVFVPTTPICAQIPTPLFAYGLRRLVPAYAGACLNVTRASDSTALDIGFLNDGSLDVAALDTFLASTTGLINTWYDQSGNGHHATSTGVRRPVLTPFQYGCSSRGIFFAPTDGTLANNQYFVIPDTMTVTSKPLSVIALTMLNNSTNSSAIWQLNGDVGAGNTQGLAMGARDGSNPVAAYFTSQRGLVNGIAPVATPVTFWWDSNTGANTLAISDRATTTLGAVSGLALKGGYISGTTLINNSSSEPQTGANVQFALVGYARSLTQAQYELGMTALYADFGVQPQVRGVILGIGDSITACNSGATYAYSRTRYYPLELRRNSTVFNVGRGGATVNGSMTRWTQNQICYDATAPWNIAAFFAGTNDIATGQTAAQTYADYVAQIAVILAKGFQVVAYTMLPRSSFTAPQEVYRLAFNQSVRDNWRALGCAALVDFANDPTMGAASAPANTALFADGTHPTDLGYSILSTVEVAVFNSLIPLRR